MLVGLVIGLVIGAFVGVFAWFLIDNHSCLEEWQSFLIAVAIALVIIALCGVFGIISDNIIQAEYIATWEITKTSYEQAINTYENYESIVKDNPNLIQDAIAKNQELAQKQYQATRWWNFYLDDSIANLQPINIGTN